MNNSSLLYEGKMKQIIATDDPDKVVVRYTDCASAFNNVKQAVIADKVKLQMPSRHLSIDILSRRVLRPTLWSR